MVEQHSTAKVRTDRLTHYARTNSLTHSPIRCLTRLETAMRRMLDVHDSDVFVMRDLFVVKPLIHLL